MEREGEANREHSPVLVFQHKMLKQTIAIAVVDVDLHICASGVSSLAQRRDMRHAARPISDIGGPGGAAVCGVWVRFFEWERASFLTLTHQDFVETHQYATGQHGHQHAKILQHDIDIERKGLKRAVNPNENPNRIRTASASEPHPNLTRAATSAASEAGAAALHRGEHALERAAAVHRLRHRRALLLERALRGAAEYGVDAVDLELRRRVPGCKKDLVEDGSWPVEAGSRPFRGRARAWLRRATLGQLLCERVRLEEGNLLEPIARLQPELTQVGRPQRDAVERV